MEDVASHLQLSREQLTALAVLSKNDYNKNISSLGPKTNIKIIRSLDASDKLNVFCSLIWTSKALYTLLSALPTQLPTCLITCPCGCGKTTQAVRIPIL